MPSRPRRLVSLAVAVVLIAACGPATVQTIPSAIPSPTQDPTAKPTPRSTRTPEPTPTSLPTPTPLPAGIADLTGVRVDDALAHRLPIAVLIDDNRVARPQSGFNGASLVYQAPADGGETRYMFVYQEGESADIGPVRSGRIYFVHWASEVRAAIAHYGGDKVSLKYIAANAGRLFTDVDALGKGAKAYHRISSRSAPHNGYTSTAALRAIALKLGGPETLAIDVHRRPFVDESAETARGTGQRIRFRYPTGAVEYRYDRSANAYVRILDGKAQVDPADRRAVTTRNVVILFQTFKIDPKIEPGHARPVVGAIGEGRALVFREGRAVEAVWRKTTETAPTRLFDSSGSEIPLVRGRTFVQIVPVDTKVSVD